MPQSTKPRYRKPDSVRQLEQMVEEDSAERHPTFPRQYIPKAKFRDDTANGLTQCIIAFINLSGGQAERINTQGRVVMQRQTIPTAGGRTIETMSSKYIPTAGVRGSADISATVCGRSVKIEIKVGNDRQRPEQIAYQRAIERAGGVYYVARDFTSFVGWFDQTFAVHHTQGRADG